MFASVYGVDKLDNTQKYSVKVYTMLALSKVKSRDALFICPFNDVHQVQRGKYMNHIYHCHRNPAHSNYVQCDFHDGHWLPNKEFAEYHMMYEHTLGKVTHKVVFSARSEGAAHFYF